MNLQRKPFEPQKLEEEREKEKGTRVSVRLNEEELAWLKQDQHILHIDRDSTTIKILAEIGHNVIHGHSNAKLLKFLCSSRRQRRVIE